MASNSDSRIIQNLKRKLNSVIKLKENKEREYQKLQILKSLKLHELKTAEDELEQLNVSFNELKEQYAIAQGEELEMELLKLSTETKYEFHKRLFEEHKEKMEDHYRTLKEEENKQLEEAKLKQQQLVEENEKRLQEAIAIEKECEAIEMECEILEKRNAAIENLAKTLPQTGRK